MTSAVLPAAILARPVLCARSPVRDGYRSILASGAPWGSMTMARWSSVWLACLLSGLFSMSASCSEPTFRGMTVHDAFRDPLVAEMVEAASNGQLSVLDAKIRAGANVNYIGTEGITPLMWVIPMNHHSHDFSGGASVASAGDQAGEYV